MPKQKTHKGLAKRVKVTARGKLKHRRAGGSHLMSGKSPKRRRRIGSPAVAHTGKAKSLKTALGAA
jgi:large subunit ribosomal protein L35